MTDSTPPPDADARRAARPVVCYPDDAVRSQVDFGAVRAELVKIEEVLVAPREAATFEVDAGAFFRIVTIEGPQVGDLNLFNRHDLSERMYTGKIRALHGTHVTTGDRVWSTFPHLRPLATITDDTLDWYGFDADGAGIHDVIGTRCDPYTQRLLEGVDYDHCCHSNLTVAMQRYTNRPRAEIEPLVHDVMNVFMATGFTHDRHRYFMKSSPARPGDHLEFFAELDLVGALSACPGGDCGDEHSSDTAVCHPLLVEILEPPAGSLHGWSPPRPSDYRWPDELDR